MRRIATWNVNTLYQDGKFENLLREAERMNLDAVGVSEVRWTGSGQTTSGGWTFYYSGGEAHRAGVGLLLRNELAGAVTGCWQLSDRVILVKIAAKPVGLNIIQVYAPTADYSDEDIETFYEQVDSARSQCKPEEITLVVGDLNAKVGCGRSGEVVGNYGLGQRNERGDRWVEWCESWEQIIMNTFFRHHPRHLYTWKCPGDRVRNQIDYITVYRRFRNSISQVKTSPGADCGVGCDHTPLVAHIKLKLKKISKNKRVRRDWNILRRDRSVGSRYAVEVRNKYEALEEVAEDEGVNRDWRILQNSLEDSAEKIIPRERKRGRQSWMTEEILDFMEQRRRMKSQSIDRYKDLDRLVKTMCKERKEEWLRERCQEMEQLERVDYDIKKGGSSRL